MDTLVVVVGYGIGDAHIYQGPPGLLALSWKLGISVAVDQRKIIRLTRLEASRVILFVTCAIVGVILLGKDTSDTLSLIKVLSHYFVSTTILATITASNDVINAQYAMFRFFCKATFVSSKLAIETSTSLCRLVSSSVVPSVEAKDPRRSGRIFGSLGGRKNCFIFFQRLMS